VLLVLVLILVLRRWEAGGVSGSAFRVLVAAAGFWLALCAVGCRGHAASEAEHCAAGGLGAKPLSRVLVYVKGLQLCVLSCGIPSVENVEDGFLVWFEQRL
jgi:hypothetical protein